MAPLANRYEFVMLFDCENGNPNGDPDAGNMPRVDAETSMGIVTDVCLKRKIRNFVEIAYEGEPGCNILIKTDKALNTKFTEAYEACELKTKEKGKNADSVRIARDYICQNYFDVRAFGAVMNTGENWCGIVRGPVQINFGKSIDPVLPQEITITRQAVTTESDKANKETEMGKKEFYPLRVIPRRGICFRHACTEDGLFGGGSRKTLDCDPADVRARPQRRPRQNVHAQAHRIPPCEPVGECALRRVV